MKRIITFVLALLMLVTLTACSSSKKNKDIFEIDAEKVAIWKSNQFQKME